MRSFTNVNPSQTKTNDITVDEGQQQSKNVKRGTVVQSEKINNVIK